MYGVTTLWNWAWCVSLKANISTSHGRSDLGSFWRDPLLVSLHSILNCRLPRPDQSHCLEWLSPFSHQQCRSHLVIKHCSPPIVCQWHSEMIKTFRQYTYYINPRFGLEPPPRFTIDLDNSIKSRRGLFKETLYSFS
jgi:hypothetical protein